MLLVIEDDLKFARILLGLALEQGFKVVVEMRGDAGIAMANELQPDAITLDIQLPDMEGWTVLDRLKHEKATRHIPVHIISADEESGRGLRLGAFAQVQKPVTKDALDEAFAKIKGILRKAETRTREALVEAMGVAISAISPRDARGFFNHCGYNTQVQSL